MDEGAYRVGQIFGSLLRFMIRTGLIYPLILVLGLYWLWNSYPQIVILGICLLVGGIVISQLVKHSQEKSERERQEEHHRRAACEEVAKVFSEKLGYIAKTLFTREELQTLVDNGISPEDFSKTIVKRIEEAPGLRLGFQSFQSFQIDVKLPEENRVKHAYIIGKAGAGKSNLIRQMISQDINNGQGIGVIAPEKEQIFEEILPYIPDERIDDVILFDPSDPRCPSFNPFYVDEGETQEEKIDEMLTLFKRISGDTTPRMEKILVESLRALVGRRGATLLDIERLLDRTDERLRQEIIRTTDNAELAHFWRDTYPTYPKDAHLGLTNRLGRFLQSETIRRVLCNPHQSLNFGRAMDTGKILLFNLSDGVLGEQNSQMLGQLIVSKFQLAVMARARNLKQDRKPFYLYLDEFQSFVDTASTSYEKILSRARKYKVGITLAHQQTGQIPSELLRDILGNVSTTVLFHVSQADAAKLAKELIRTENGELVHVEPEQILSLKVGQAFCKVGQQSFPMQTYLADQNPNQNRARLVAERAMENRGIQPNENHTENPYGIAQLFHQPLVLNPAISADKSEENQDTPLWTAPPTARPKVERLPANGKRQLQPVAIKKVGGQSVVDAVLSTGFDPEKIF